MDALPTIADLAKHLDDILNASHFDDRSCNGIQVESGRMEVRRLATGVTASLALIEKAAEAEADTILAHHGLFWKGQDPVLIGGLGARVRRLFEEKMNLLAYHLPIDAHPVLGNNAVLADKLNLTEKKPWGDYNGSMIGISGRLSPRPVETFLKSVESVVGGEVLHFTGGPDVVESVAVVSGGASGLGVSAARSGFHVFITGEPSEPCMHIAAEERIHIFAAGHHNTETFGVQAVGNHLAKEFGLEVFHINIPNPV